MPLQDLRLASELEASWHYRAHGEVLPTVCRLAWCMQAPCMLQKRYSADWQYRWKAPVQFGRSDLAVSDPKMAAARAKELRIIEGLASVLGLDGADSVSVLEAVAATLGCTIDDDGTVRLEVSHHLQSARCLSPCTPYPIAPTPPSAITLSQDDAEPSGRKKRRRQGTAAVEEEEEEEGGEEEGDEEEQSEQGGSGSGSSEPADDEDPEDLLQVV